MFLKTIATIKEGRPFTLLCKVVNLRMDYRRKFLILRVIDYTKTTAHFRKFDLDNLKGEIYGGNTEVEMWKMSSKKVDVVVNWPSETVVSLLKKEVVVYLQKLVCRGVPIEPSSLLYELYLNNKNGSELHVMTCDDVLTCQKERLDREVLMGGLPYIGTIDLFRIRKGISFTLVCEVVKYGREKNTGHVVLRVRDSTRTKIRTRKYDFENFDNLDQSNEEVDFHGGGSTVVDVVITSPPQDLDDMSSKVVMLGPVECDRVPLSAAHDPPNAIHVLRGDGSLPSFEVKPLHENMQRVAILRRKLSAESSKQPAASQEHVIKNIASKKRKIGECSSQSSNTDLELLEEYGEPAAQKNDIQKKGRRRRRRRRVIKNTASKKRKIGECSSQNSNTDLELLEEYGEPAAQKNDIQKKGRRRRRRR